MTNFDPKTKIVDRKQRVGGRGMAICETRVQRRRPSGDTDDVVANHTHTCSRSPSAGASATGSVYLLLRCCQTSRKAQMSGFGATWLRLKMKGSKELQQKCIHSRNSANYVLKPFFWWNPLELSISLKDLTRLTPYSNCGQKYVINRLNRVLKHWRSRQRVSYHSLAHVSEDIFWKMLVLPFTDFKCFNGVIHKIIFVKMTSWKSCDTR